jgi:hypothetical protein
MAVSGAVYFASRQSANRCSCGSVTPRSSGSIRPSTVTTRPVSSLMLRYPHQATARTFVRRRIVPSPRVRTRGASMTGGDPGGRRADRVPRHVLRHRFGGSSDDRSCRSADVASGRPPDQRRSAVVADRRLYGQARRVPRGLPPRRFTRGRRAAPFGARRRVQTPLSDPVSRPGTAVGRDRPSWRPRDNS